jgi:DNA-binding Lrp family transcriptional regulator
MSENLIENLLSKGEQLVYEYIKEEAEKHGSVRESMDSIAESIRVRYADRIPVRNVKAPNGETIPEKTFSEATVHRAITKLKKEGIIQVNPSNDKAVPNEIIFYGLPNEDEQLQEILEMASKLNLSLSRLQTIITNKEKEIYQLKLDKKNLYKELDGLKEQLRRMNLLNIELQKALRDVESGKNPFKEGTVIGISDLGDGTKAYIVKSE